ncbi:MAG: cytochrome C biogenesis protein, partial [Cyanobacteria bacterium J06648_11]
MKLLKFAIGLLLGAILILVPFSAWQSTSTSEVQLLAVQVDGRKKPLDTVARETVTQIHGSPSYRTADGET